MCRAFIDHFGIKSFILSVYVELPYRMRAYAHQWKVRQTNTVITAWG